MKKFYNLILLAAICFGITACATTPIVNTTDISKVDWSNIKDMKEGSSCSYHLLGFLGSFGRSRLPEAIESANIKKVYAIDETYGYYILFGRTCLNVWGE